MAKSTDTLGGWYPQADRIGIPDTNFSPGNRGRKAICLHIMGGTMIGTISWFASSKSKVSAHFGIDRQGGVKQFVSLIDTPYSNGLSYDAARKLWVDPQGNVLRPPYTPTWELLEPPYNPNTTVVSIEREGYPTDPITPAMQAATIALLRWLAQQYPALAPYRVKRTLIGHNMIGPVHRPNCPGSATNLVELAEFANAMPSTAYRTIAPTWVSETPSPRGPVALKGAAILESGEVVQVDEVRSDGWCHLASGVGFVAIGGLEAMR